MFSLRSRAVRFRQLWMETRLELIYNVVIATRTRGTEHSNNQCQWTLGPTLDNLLLRC